MSLSNPSKVIYPIIIIALSALLCFYIVKSGSDNIDNPTDETFIEMKTNKTFQDVADDAEFAISERNFRITNTLKIGNAIKVRGNKTFPENNVILFCNIQFAEDMLAIDPSYVNYCPGQIAVREEGDKVVISAPLVPLSHHSEDLDSMVNEVNRLVREAVEFSAEEWQEVYD